MLNREVLVARMLPGDRERRFVRRDAIDFSIVERVTGKQIVAAAESVIAPELPEVFVGGLRLREEILACAAAQRMAIRVREQEVQVRRNRGMKRNRLPRQNAGPRVLVRHRRHTSHAETLDKRLDRPEIKRPVLSNRPTEDTSKLMPKEIGNRTALGVEVVLRVEG